MGCDLPLDARLTEAGWEWRCNADDNRAREVSDTYRELGFEVRLVPVEPDRLNESCSSCAETLCALNAVYVRKPTPASAG